MKKLIAPTIVAILTLALTLATVAPAMADCKPGPQGCEGQPGNQGNGLNGIEGQPGNQGGGQHNP